ncbi:MAG: hypothetical protein CVU97_04155, partial [Firmicutes bacterium HGW-Firmicutes-21]
FYGIYEGYASYFILLIVVFFPFFSLVISLFGMLRVRIGMLPLPSEIKRGEPANAVIRVYTRCWFPLSILKITYIAKNITFCRDKSKKTFFLYGCSYSDVSLPLDTNHIGSLYLDIVKIRVYDYLGLFRISLKTPEKRHITVLPRLIRPEIMPVLPMDKIGGKGLKPKPGGGFAEDYDLRQYRIGDPMNLIHWKLTSKLDELITREPLVSEKGMIFICFNLFGTVDDLDSVFGQIAYISQVLLGRMIEFNLCWYGNDGELNIVEVKDRNEFFGTLVGIFSSPIEATGKAIDKNAYRAADWHYIVRPNLRQGGERA